MSIVCLLSPEHMLYEDGILTSLIHPYIPNDWRINVLNQYY